jgi:hypothetical protein
MKGTLRTVSILALTQALTAPALTQQVTEAQSTTRGNQSSAELAPRSPQQSANSAGTEGGLQEIVVTAQHSDAPSPCRMCR